MRRGRKPAGLKLVDATRGSEFAKQRACVVLQTLMGHLSVDEACAELGIGRSRFYELRQTVLNGAVAAGEPQPAGRPPEEPAVSQELEAAEREKARLLKELTLTRAEAELSALLSVSRLKKKPQVSPSTSDGRGNSSGSTA